MSTPLLSTKLNTPPVMPNWVPRPHLLARLNEGLQDGRLVMLVCAPAGYGKTTLVSQWVHSLSERQSEQGPGSQTTAPPVRCAWLTLDAADDDLVRFLEYLVQALQPIQSGVGKGILATMQAPRPTSPPSLATLLINDLVEVEGHFVLVLEDYHTIQAQAIQEFLSFLIEHAPPQMRLVLVTRADPPLPLARLRAKGQLVEVRLADLRFTANDALAFFNTLKLGLAPELVATLVERTEGWASGLQLAALALRSTDDPAAFVQNFTGQHEYIADYLTDEVLAGQPAEVRSFLLQTSLLEQLSGPLCAAVTGQVNAQETLRYVSESNLFVLPLDRQRQWYRYHSLFADLLRRRLQQTYGQMVGELHRRASQWYSNNGMLAAAVEHALAGHDDEGAGLLIQRAAEGALWQGKAITVTRWLDGLPAAVKDSRPILWVFQGLALALQSKSSPEVRGRLADLLSSGAAQGLEGEVATLQALYAILQGNAVRTIQLAQEALRLLPPERHFFVCLAADAQGMGFTLLGDLAAAVSAFQQVVDTASQAGNVMMEVLALSNLAGLHLQQGHLRAAAASYHQVLDLAQQRLGKASAVTFKALLGLGELAREWNDLEGALHYFQQAAVVPGQVTDLGTPIAYLSMARVKADQGDWDKAQAYLEQARRLAQDSTATQLDDRMVEAMQARFWLGRGELGLAARWAHARGLLARPLAAILADADPAAVANELLQTDYLTVARLFLAQGEPQKALDTLEPLLQISEQTGNIRRVLGILAMKAVGLQQRGQRDQAVRVLGRALELAEPEGFQRIFLDEGEPMARLLYAAIERGFSPVYAGKLLAALCAELPTQAVAGMQLDAMQGLIEPLSERELDVLRFLAEGLSNREIAARLHVSLSTVKWHTANIYGKLNVNSRTQAVARARALGLPLLP